MSRLNELAERCEKATGPDRELDAAVAEALGLPHGRVTCWCNKENGDYYVIDECAKSFTASLDAAMSLVPEGWFVILDDLGADGMPLATLHTPAGMRKVIGMARDLKLALCAAALRASASQQNGGEG